jgi:tRNA A-37 threonylcarbamoyl transferase component Bud32
VAGGAGQPDRPGEDTRDIEAVTATSGPGVPDLAALLGSRYRTVARLGSGAFGEVYRAHDTLLGRDVAVKRIRLDALVEPAQLDEAKRRFLREAQLAARLHHPNIVTTHDIVEGAASSLIVMELVEGETLQSLLRSRGRLTLQETTAVVEQVARALDHAHANGIVHRDVKPGNVMIESSGQVKVMDFGIAKAEAGQNLTTTGLVMGTPNYMSPEQARGLKLDGRSDLFSLGCVFYECLTGARPFGGGSVSAILLRILNEEPPLPDFDTTGLPREIGPLLGRALAKDPTQRFASGAELVAALRLVDQATIASLATRRESETPPLPTAVREGSRAARPGSRGITGKVVAALATVAVALLAAWLLPPALSRGEKRVVGEGGGLVVEEAPSLLDRALGRSSHLVVTVPAGSRLHLFLRTPLSSSSASIGEAISAEVASPLSVESVEAIAVGTRFVGRVTDASPAASAQGRGHMTLQFETLESAGNKLAVRTRALVLRAPSQKRKEAGIVGGLAGVGAAVGGILGGRGGAVAGTVVGGAAGVAVVKTDRGVGVSLAESAPLTVELLEPISLTRPSPR